MFQLLDKADSFHKDQKSFCNIFHSLAIFLCGPYRRKNHGRNHLGKMDFRKQTVRINGWVSCHLLCYLKREILLGNFESYLTIKPPCWFLQVDLVSFVLSDLFFDEGFSSFFSSKIQMISLQILGYKRKIVIDRLSSFKWYHIT